MIFSCWFMSHLGASDFIILNRGSEKRIFLKNSSSSTVHIYIITAFSQVVHTYAYIQRRIGISEEDYRFSRYSFIFFCLIVVGLETS